MRYVNVWRNLKTHETFREAFHSAHRAELNAVDRANDGYQLLLSTQDDGVTITSVPMKNMILNKISEDKEKLQTEKFHNRSFLYCD